MLTNCARGNNRGRSGGEALLGRNQACWAGPSRVTEAGTPPTGRKFFSTHVHVFKASLFPLFISGELKLRTVRVWA